MKIIRSMFDKCIEAVSIGIFALMVLLVTFQVFVRYVLNSPSAFSETLTRYLFVWLVLITSTYAFGKRDHMCISYLKDKLPLKGQRMVNILIEVITFFFAAAIMIYGGVRISAMQMVQLDSVLKIPTGLIYSIIPISGVGIAFYSLCNLMTEYTMLKEGK